jgi:hypothetical protein
MSPASKELTQMGRPTKLDLDEVLPEFGVTRRQVDAEIKRRLSTSGRPYTTAEIREHFRRLSAERSGRQRKKSCGNDR